LQELYSKYVSDSQGHVHPAGVRVAVIDDEVAVARAMMRLLSLAGIEATHFGSPPAIEELVRSDLETQGWDVILLDVNMPGLDGLAVLRQLRQRDLTAAVVMLTGDDSAGTATAALRGGAFHYVVKANAEQELVPVVQAAARRAAAERQLRRPQVAGDDLEQLVLGDSAAMRELRRQIRHVAASDVSVLISGESGTGKEVVARALHRASRRRAAAFVPVNCGAIPDGVIDSELFGHVRGSFTGAHAARSGVFVEAHGGTLFLDEVGDMPLAVQPRLLRAIQHGEIRPVGSESARTVDVRVVAATNVDLERAVANGAFRADLLFRLNVVRLEVPPLRDRTDDLPALIAAMIQRYGGGQPRRLTDAAIDAMYGYGWPGNVRELENTIRHALVMAGGDTIDLPALPTHVRGARLAKGSARSLPILPAELDAVSLTEAKRQAALDFEREYLLRLMERVEGSISAAARIANMDRTNFRRLLQRHSIDSAEFKP
jgi:DNA-binding NtrC family response regulator